MSTEATTQELCSALGSLSEISQRSAAHHDQIISKLEGLEQTKTDVIHWQCYTDKGWQDYNEQVTSQLEAAHNQSGVVMFEINETAYTANTVTSEQRRATTPFTGRAIRRIVESEATPESKHVMAVVQTIKDFAKHQADSTNRLLAELRHRLTVLESLDKHKHVWECQAESDWVRYSADISDTIEAGYKVSSSVLLFESAV
jgi:WWE domain